MEKSARVYINIMTRNQMIKDIKSKGGEHIKQLLKLNIKCKNKFGKFATHLFQEVVVSDIIARDAERMNSIREEILDDVLNEIANRYIKFGELGYKFVVGNYLDRVYERQ